MVSRDGVVKDLERYADHFQLTFDKSAVQKLVDPSHPTEWRLEDHPELQSRSGLSRFDRC